MPVEDQEGLRRLLDDSPIAVAVFGSDGRCAYANRLNLELCRRDEAGFRGLPARDHYVDAGERKAVTEELRAKGCVQGREVRIARGDGSHFWALLSISSLPGAAGADFVTWVVDISDRKRAERELIESERVTLSILDDSPVGARITRALDDTIVYVNNRYVEQFGVPKDKLIGSPVIGAYADPRMRQRVIGRFFEHGRLDDEEVRFKRADGEEFSVLMSLRPFHYAGEEGRLAWFYDITERKKAEDALRESERLMLSMLDHAPVGARVTRATDNVIVFVNSPYAEQFGVPKDKLIGSPVVGAYVDPRARQRLIDRFYANGRLDDEEVRFKRAGGEEFLALMSMRPFHYAGDEARLTWFYDITERKKAEQELRAAKEAAEAALAELTRTQEQLVTAEKLASLGRVTAGIAHEIKNPLNFVNNFSGVSSELIDELQDTLKRPFDDKARAEFMELTNTLRGNLDKVVQHGKRADAIVKNMLLHSREGSGEHRPVDINSLVEESLNFAYHGARAEKQGFNITLERSFDPAAGEVDVFPQDITRVLLNLISNGFYAATKRRAETNGGDYKPTLAAATKNLGDRVEISIRDNGTGIPPEVKEKIFNPFFTTKPAGEGTGLGLSISHDIVVKQHGGAIEVDTQPGVFTEITVILPRAAVVS